jgi:hypothetical protein
MMVDFAATSSRHLLSSAEASVAASTGQYQRQKLRLQMQHNSTTHNHQMLHHSITQLLSNKIFQWSHTLLRGNNL